MKTSVSPHPLGNVFSYIFPCPLALVGSTRGLSDSDLPAQTLNDSPCIAGDRLSPPDLYLPTEPRSSCFAIICVSIGVCHEENKRIAAMEGNLEIT